MKIEKNCVALFDYRLSDAEGVEIEASSEKEPMAALIGHGNLMPALEQEILGKVAGDELSVTLAPEKAYGLRNKSAVQRVPIKHLLNGKKKLRPGDHVRINTEQGARNATVLKVGKFNVDVDTNHPLAGKTLTFFIRIDSVREASAEEIAHGHAHGIGGHHH